MARPPLRFDVAHRDRTYAVVGDEELSVRVYRPVTRAAQAGLRFPLVIHVPGGGIDAAAVDHDPDTHKLLACHGIVTAVAGVRHGDGHRHPAAAVDTDRVVRRLVGEAAQLAVDPGRVVLVGSGWGAHAAMFAVLTSQGLARLGVPIGVFLVEPRLAPGAEDAATRDEADAVARYFGDGQRQRRAGIAEMVYDGVGVRHPHLSIAVSPTSAGRVSADELAHAWRRHDAAVVRVELDAGDDLAGRDHLVESVTALVGLSGDRPRLVVLPRRPAPGAQ